MRSAFPTRAAILDVLVRAIGNTTADTIERFGVWPVDRWKAINAIADAGFIDEQAHPRSALPHLLWDHEQAFFESQAVPRIAFDKIVAIVQSLSEVGEAI